MNTEIVAAVITALAGYLGKKWLASRALVKETAELVVTLTDALADKTVDQAEADRILKELEGVIAETRNLLK